MLQVCFNKLTYMRLCLSGSCSRYVVHCLARLEKSAGDKLEPNCSSDDADSDFVATKKTRLLATSCSPVNDIVPSARQEIEYCQQLQGNPRISALKWHATLIQRHLAWTQRLSQSISSPIVSFHNSLSG